ncbi:MAG TPA: peptidoglycan DD-metalloendopeptidase family protein [Myxococcales bacterium]|nr:peptidoglycan DD-metalloendopeptidase family protein [Myxococcales bacterium]
MIALLLLILAAPPPKSEQEAAAVLSAAAQRERAAQLAKERAMAEQLAGREATLLGKLAEAERQVDVEARALRAAQVRLRTAEERLSPVEAKSRKAETELQAAADAAAPRLVARYRLGREGYLRFLLGAQSIPDLLRRRRLFDALLEADLGALQRLRSLATAAKAARDELAQVRDEEAKAAAEEADKRAALEAHAAQQRRLVASVQDDKATHEQAASELEEAARALAGEVRQLQQAAPAARPVPDEPPVRRMRRKLLFPVESGRIEARFGRSVDERYGTVTLQRGIDVRCEEGTPVRAIHAGRIVHAGWFHGYGNLIIVDHGDGYFSLMAHLGTLARAKGDEVRRGDVVGTVGDSGSLKGTYLYFELRQGQMPLDPERWLARPKKPRTGARAGAPISRGP